MKIKIFQAKGGGLISIDDLEDIINKWLDENENKLKIIDKQVNAVSTGEMNGELFQSLIVCIWYEQN